MQHFHNLQVWQKAHQLTLLAYALTVEFPKDEIFGLRTQIRKTAVDVAAFIAEGSVKATDAEFAQCIASALGHNKRLEYFVLVAKDLGLVHDEVFDQLNDAVVEVGKMLSSFYKTLRRG